MSERFEYTDRAAFLAKLQEVVRAGTPPSRIRVLMPYYVHEVERILKPKKAPLEWIAGLGALAGAAAALNLTWVSSLSWPLVTGGKPIVSLMQFGIICIELGILCAALAAFGAFLFFGRFPNLRGIREPVEHGNRFVIMLKESK